MKKKEKEEDDDDEEEEGEGEEVTLRRASEIELVEKRAGREMFSLCHYCLL